jgi:hypothetical protein
MCIREKAENQRDERLFEKIHQVMEMDGQAGLAAKVCMFAGLTESEVAYCHNQEVCNNPCCNCHKLHIINRRNGMTVVVVNWSRGGRRIYLALLPTLLWEQFRTLTGFNESDIRATAKIVKKETG